MLMRNQHLYQSLPIEVYTVTADYYYPELGYLDDFFAIRGRKIVGVAGGFELTTLVLSQVLMTSQPQ